MYGRQFISKFRIPFALSLICLTFSGAQANEEIKNGILQLFGGLLGAAQITAAKEEWEKVPADEFGCINVAVKTKNNSIEQLIKKGVKPSHRNLQKLITGCRQLIAKFPVTSNVSCTVKDANGNSFQTRCDKKFVLNDGNSRRIISRDVAFQMLFLGRANQVQHGNIETNSAREARENLAKEKRRLAALEKKKKEDGARKKTAKLKRKKKAEEKKRLAVYEKKEAARRKAEKEKEEKARLAAKAAAESNKQSGKSTLNERMAALKDLKDVGLLSLEEFQARKNAVLDEFLGVKSASASVSKATAKKDKPSKYADVKFGKYYALVIGNNEYKYLPKLKTAVKDAKAVAKTLRDTFGFEVKMLINATRSQILDAFDNYEGTLEKSDNLLLYYAGHGWLDKGREEGFWLPVNAKTSRRSQWISNATITSTLKALQAKHVMIVADSCFSGTLTRGIKVTKKIADYVRDVVGKKARIALTSGGLEPVEDGGGGKNSPFATAFIKVLNGTGEVLTGTDLFKRVKRPVQVNADQTPNYADIRKAGHDGGDFLFVRKR
jgi:hypothetical protein